MIVGLRIVFVIIGLLVYGSFGKRALGGNLVVRR